MRALHVGVVLLAAMNICATPLSPRNRSGKDVLTRVLTDVKMTPAQTAFNETRCRIDRESDGSRTAMAQRVSDMDDLVVKVPAAEEALMRKEYSLAETGAQKMAEFRRRYPLYAAMKAHDTFHEFSADVGELWMAKTASPKTHIMAASWLIGETRLVKFAWDDYAASPQARTLPPAVLRNWDDNSDMWPLVQDYIWCWAIAIKK